MSRSGFLDFGFPTKDQEERFRRDFLPDDKISARKVFTLVVAVIVGFIVLDYYFLPPASKFISILCRLVTILVCISILLVISRKIRVRSFDRIISTGCLVVYAHMLLVAYFRPGDYVTIVAYDIITLVGIYLAVPIPLKYQALPAFSFTLGSAILWLVVKHPPWETLETAATMSAYVIANFVGVFSSISMNKMKRKQFSQFEEEKALKENLESALSEIKVLRGIIPICAACKKIRNDKGFYESVESYIKRHSEADFTHGMCEDCMRDWYPEHYPKIPGQRQSSGQTSGSDKEES